MWSPVHHYVATPTYMYLSHAGHANLKDKADTLQDKVETLQDKVDTLQDKVDTLQDKVVNLEEKLDTFQNTTEASTREHHHEVVELLQNTSCSSDGKIWSHSQAPKLQNNGRGWYIHQVRAIKDRHRPDILLLRKNCIW